MDSNIIAYFQLIPVAINTKKTIKQNIFILLIHVDYVFLFNSS